MLSLNLTILVGFVAAAELAALLCRLNELHWRTHAAAEVLMHIGLAVGCCWSGLEAFQSQVTPGTLGVLLAAGSWVAWSLPSWRRRAREADARNHPRAPHDPL